MIASACQRIAHIGMLTAIAVHIAWRKVRLTSRTEKRLRPTSLAISGAVAEAMPMPTMRKAK